MKALARSYIWWPKLDADFKQTLKKCKLCQATHHALVKTYIHLWEVTKAPWLCLHIDFDGPFQGQIFFLVVDSFSK